jgi:hypothetical protein
MTRSRTRSEFPEDDIHRPGRPESRCSIVLACQRESSFRSLSSSINRKRADLWGAVPDRRKWSSKNWLIREKLIVPFQVMLIGGVENWRDAGNEAGLCALARRIVVLGRYLVVHGGLVDLLKVVPKILCSFIVLIFDRYPSSPTSRPASVFPVIFPPNPSVRPVHFLF